MDRAVSPEHTVVWDDVEEVRFLFVFTRWLLCLGEMLLQICLFMYSYSSSSGSSNRLDERGFPLLPGPPWDVEIRVSADERKTCQRGWEDHLWIYKQSAFNDEAGDNGGSRMSQRWHDWPPAFSKQAKQTPNDAATSLWALSWKHISVLVFLLHVWGWRLRRSARHAVPLRHVSAVLPIAALFQAPWHEEILAHLHVRHWATALRTLWHCSPWV